MAPQADADIETSLAAERTPEEQALLEEVAAYYHATLKASPDALKNIQWQTDIGRGLVEHFQLGYSNGSLVAGVAADNPYKRYQLAKLGIIGRKEREYFSGTLVVPIKDAVGRVHQLCGGAHHVYTGRSTPERYLAGADRGVFHAEAFARDEELVVAPSVLDALCFWHAGFVNVTAAGAYLVLSAAMVAAMKRAGTKRVLLAHHDRPEGEHAALVAAQVLAGESIAAYRVPIESRAKHTSPRWCSMIREALPLLGAPPRPELSSLPLTWRRTGWVRS